MHRPIKRFSYKAFGLTIASDFELPELQPVNLEDDLSDIAIFKTNLSFKWTELVGQDEDFVIKPDFVMFRVPYVAIYLIHNGNEIFVTPLASAEEDQVRLYILGTCMGAILLQRKVLPLHGNAVVVDGKAYAVVGDSGAGNQREDKKGEKSNVKNRKWQVL